MQIRSELLSREDVLAKMTKADTEITRAGLTDHICDLMPAQFERELRRIIGVICVQYSIRVAPDEFATNIIVKFVRNRYQHLTLQEFELAFELNLLNESDDKPKHFQNLSVEFITDVVKHFMQLKSDALASLKRATPVKQLSEHQSTDKDYYNRLMAYVKENKQLPIFWNWSAVYDHMEASGMVTETDTELKQFKLHVKAGVKTQATLDKMKAADAIERMRIEESLNPKNLAAIYKAEYVKMKFGTDEGVWGN